MAGPSRGIAVRIALALLLTAACPFAGQAASKGSKAAKAPEMLRTSDPRLTDLVDQGLVRSPTLRALQAHLQQSQVIIYVTWGLSLPVDTVGRTRLIGAAAGWRYLSVEIADHVSRLDALAILGHELQHATEIADAVQVVDDASMAELYGRIGLPRGRAQSSLTFETQDAIDAGRRVHMELASGF
jgi:hypothetical protein